MMLLSESFFQLLQSPGHWLFEIFLMAVFDGLVGALAWPFIKRHIHRDVDSVAMHKEDREDYDDASSPRQRRPKLAPVECRTAIIGDTHYLPTHPKNCLRCDGNGNAVSGGVALYD